MKTEQVVNEQQLKHLQVSAEGEKTPTGAGQYGRYRDNHSLVKAAKFSEVKHSIFIECCDCEKLKSQISAS